MKVLIIEDEINAARKLETMLSAADSNIKVIAVTDSVRDTLAWLQNNPPPDLAFVDIQLADDTSFEIFRQYKIRFPVIFVTAYDEYILQSFEHNSVDYLLKPYSEERLKKALEKVKQLEKHFVSRHIYNMLDNAVPAYKSRYIVKKGLECIPVETSHIAYFFTEHKITFLKDRENNVYIIDKNLAELETSLDPATFLRLNRKYIAGITSLKSYKPNGTGRILVSLSPPASEEIIVSRETAPAFRKWAGDEE